MNLLKQGVGELRRIVPFSPRAFLQVVSGNLSGAPFSVVDREDGYPPQTAGMTTGYPELGR